LKLRRTWHNKNIMLYIYKITNKLNQKIYIGKNEKDKDKNYFGSGLLIKRAILKYGIDNFVKEIIDIADSKEKLNELEKHWISFYNSQNPIIGYNIMSGGDGGDTFTNHPDKEYIRIKKKLSASHNPLSQEHKEKISKATLGKPKSDEARDKMSKARTGKKFGPRPDSVKEKIRNSKKGIATLIFTDEIRKKMSMSRKGKIKSDKHKKAISDSKKGIKFSAEHKEKLRLAWIKRKHDKQIKKNLQ